MPMPRPREDDGERIVEPADDSDDEGLGGKAHADIGRQVEDHAVEPAGGTGERGAEAEGDGIDAGAG